MAKAAALTDQRMGEGWEGVPPLWGVDLSIWYNCINTVEVNLLESFFGGACPGWPGPAIKRRGR